MVIKDRIHYSPHFPNVLGFAEDPTTLTEHYEKDQETPKELILSFPQLQWNGALSQKLL